MKKFKMLGFFFVASLFIVILSSAGFFLYLWYLEKKVVEQSDSYRKIREDVNFQMGFEHSGRYTEDGKELIAIDKVKKGKPMYEAGFRDGDVIRFKSEDTLYKRIVFGQGKVIRVPVRRGNQDMAITVHVPALQLRDDPKKIYWMTFTDFWR